jgi:hypothetical protein
MTQTPKRVPNLLGEPPGRRARTTGYPCPPVRAPCAPTGGVHQDSTMLKKDFCTRLLATCQRIELSCLMR